VDVIATVTDGAGRERYRRVTSVTARSFETAGGTYRYSLQIPLADASGDMLLTLAVRPSGSTAHAVSQRTAFVVNPR
jgi:hypothetical protein